MRKYIVGCVILLSMITACSRTSAPARTEYQIQKLDELIGVYNGTRTTGRGPYGWQLLVFKDGTVHRAALYVYRISGSPSNLSNYSYLANINFNAARGRYEFKGYSYISSSSSDGDFSSWTGTLNNRTFSGSNGTDTFNLRRIARSDNKYTGPHNHQGADEGTITRAATCTADGEKTFYCIFCGEETTRETLPKLPHTPSGRWVVLQEPACAEEGNRVQYCTVCNEETIKEPVPKLPHKPSGEWVVLTEPLCNEPGRRVQYCVDCGGEGVSEEIAPLTNSDHVFESSVSGNIFFPPILRKEECTVCGFVEQRADFSYVWVSPAILLGLLVIVLVTLKARTGMRKKKTFVCPYCFDTRLVQEIQFRCSNKDCIEVDDFEFTKYMRGDLTSPLKGKITFTAPVTKNYTIPKNVECPSCHRKTSKAVCPSCHNNLPESTLVGEDLIISTIGSRDVGKSHFVGVIIKELLDRVADKFDGSLTGFEDTMARYEQHFGRNLYVDLVKLGRTVSSTSTTDNNAYKPFIFTLSIKAGGLLGKKIKNYTLVFYDTAGEDLKDFDTMYTVNRYLCKSAGIIVLLDPMQMGSVRNQLDDEMVSRVSTVEEHEATRADDIMMRVSQLIRDDKGMKSTKAINIPVAAVFSKFDTIESIVPRSLTVLEPSPHCNERAFVMSDQHAIKDEIENLLKNWGATAFTKQLEVNYANYSYFAVSSLGFKNSPRSDMHIDRPRPHRIEDPLLWILKEKGVIKTEKRGVIKTVIEYLRDRGLLK